MTFPTYRFSSIGFEHEYLLQRKLEERQLTYLSKYLSQQNVYCLLICFTKCKLLKYKLNLLYFI